MVFLDSTFTETMVISLLLLLLLTHQIAGPSTSHGEFGLKTLGKFLHDLLTTLRWDTYTIIIDETTEKVGVSLHLLLRKSHGMSGGLVKYLGVSDLEFILRLGDRHFIVLCDEMVRMASKENLFSDYFAWLIVMDDDDDSSEEGHFHFQRDIRVYSNHSVLVTRWNRLMKRFQIFALRGLEGGRVASTSPSIGHWTPENGISLHDVTTPVHLTRSVKGKTFLVAIIHDPPYAILNESVHGLTATGYDVDVLKLLSKRLQFQFRFVRVRDNSYGVEKDGMWSGTMGYLQRRECDMALPVLSRTTKRNRVADISAPLSHAQSRFLVRRPRSEARFEAYTAPFHSDVWIVSAVSFVAFATALVVTERLHASTEHGYSTAFVMCACAIAQRGCSYEPPGLPGRIVFGTFALASLITFSCYSSVLTSFLTIAIPVMPFENMAQLVEKVDYGVGFVRGTAYDELLNTSAVGDTGTDLFYQLYVKIYADPEGNLVPDNHLGIEKAYREKYAFFSWVDGILYELQGNCSFMFARDQYLNRYYGIAFQKYSPYEEILTLEILKLTESGTLGKLRHKYFPPLDSLGCSRVASRSEPAELRQLATVFVLLAGAIAVSVLALALEKCIYPPKLLPSTPRPKRNASLCARHS